MPNHLLTADTPLSLFDHPATADFHPAVGAWFSRTFPAGPTEAQAQAWPSIESRSDTLVAAPTGSGKTLAAFLVAIDRMYKRPTTESAAKVVYVSPLRALATDIAHNLERPIAEISRIANELGFDPPKISVGVRTGDTPRHQRSAMVSKPPSFVVTTPESLYLMCTSSRSRAMLRSVDTVIIDEIHALVGDKRGAHLALTLERLEQLCARRPIRVGLSATQRPIEVVARLLVGARRHPDGSPKCRIVDTGHLRELDVGLVIPGSELEAIAPAEQMGEVLDLIAEQVRQHRTTLVFVNTRRLAERVSHELAERLCTDDVAPEDEQLIEQGDPTTRIAAHHGSLSKDRRLLVEQKLRAGELDALVATASLELGIDVGPVDLVCQIGSPRNIATFLQRVGRANHQRFGVPKGRIYPQTRDDLLECTALLAAVRAGRLDALEAPEQPHDILVQQLVAEVASRECDVDDLFALVRRAAPYEQLARSDFDRCLERAAKGVTTGRGVRARWIHHDETNGVVRDARGARMAALMNGGAIPELGDYKVLLDPDETLLGTVNEDWATESMPGDIFTLGTHSWRIRRIEPGVVRVVDAEGLPPSIPVWFGEAPGRTLELSEEVAAIRRQFQSFVEETATDDRSSDFVGWLRSVAGVCEAAADQIERYLAASYAVLGCLPTRDRLVVERFFDETGGMQLVLHSPHGARLNRAFGLSLRKKFCKNFDFELQAAASDDAVLLSLGPQHSFELSDVAAFLSSRSLKATLTQAVLVPPSPMFLSRWRWNLNRSLIVLRWKSGRKNPPPIQRMEADDVMAALFPVAAACQENVSGPIELPDDVIVQQTMNDTLHEAMDLAGLTTLIEGIESGEVEVRCVDSSEPSPLAHELLVGKPFTFLDDAEAIDRRSRAVPLRRGLPDTIGSTATLAEASLAAVAEQVKPDPRTPDELYDLLDSLVVFRADENFAPLFDALVDHGRATLLTSSSGEECWIPRAGVEQAALIRPDLTDQVEAGSEGAEDLAERRASAVSKAVRGRLELCGATTSADLAASIGVEQSSVDFALVGLENEGFAMRLPPGFRPGTELWSCRRLLQRAHTYSRRTARQRVEPAAAQDFMRFLFEWHALAPDVSVTDAERSEDPLSDAISKLQGWHAAADAWERDLLSQRVRSYSGAEIDLRCLAGEVSWGRLAVGETPVRGTSRATPVSMFFRSDLSWIGAAHDVGEATSAIEGLSPAAAAALDVFDSSGAVFHFELAQTLGLSHGELERALWELVGSGLAHADTVHSLRSMFGGRVARDAPKPRVRGLRRGARGRALGEGRWCRFRREVEDLDPDDLAEAVAEQMLERWGVVFFDLAARESFRLPWREVLWALRRMEARGTVLGGRFVGGFGGEQYALPAAAERLAQVAKVPRTGATITVNGCDPCNLTGIITPGARIAARTTNVVRYTDGLPVGV